MKYYPVFLKIKAKKCLVAGGGRVGTRKATTLVRSGARVTVVAKKMCEELEKLPGIALEKRAFQPRDLAGIFLVFAATNDAQQNRQILAYARAAGVWCNSVDAPEQGDFILPAVTSRGDLICAVSTCGASPALARKIRQDLDRTYGPEYATFLMLMRAIRTKLLAFGHDPEGHKMVFRQVMEKNIPALIADQDIPAIDTILAELLGSGFCFQDLISQEE
ncbi:MAG TPA: bifunctional precorrin-2 dehydrogenase/sirohydrochlorin ferrochelatase [Desulfotignum sp.]|nr:bifunctional precorrin-2 dehydrogenase/sirohydrochlorin ferrochelatase [Desulfotignum sp.]